MNHFTRVVQLLFSEMFQCVKKYKYKMSTAQWFRNKTLNEMIMARAQIVVYEESLSTQKYNFFY